jgi:hypothetical protein
MPISHTYYLEQETLDPDLVRYREQLKDLQLMRVEVADRVPGTATSFSVSGHGFFKQKLKFVELKDNNFDSKESRCINPFCTWNMKASKRVL